MGPGEPPNNRLSLDPWQHTATNSSDRHHLPVRQVWDGYLQYAGRYGYLMMLVTIRSSSIAWRRPGLSGWGGPGGRFGVYFGGRLVSW